MSACKRCGATISWIKVSGRWHCHNPDGSDHWALCSKLRFAEVKRTGTLVIEDQDKAYLSPLAKHGKQYFEQHSPVMTGRHYKPSGDCIGCCVPWEICSWPCQDALP